VCGLNLKAPALNHQIIHQINSNPKSTWVAGINSRFVNATLADAKRLCGTIMGGPALPRKPHIPESIKKRSAPDDYDVRTEWQDKCPSTNEVRDQAACGSCWAFGAVEAMTDRLCIASGGQNTDHLSAEDMLSCCDSCGFGCDGGFPGAAWNYWVSTGLVTGGNYGSADGCMPYTIPGCDHHVNGSLPPCGDIQPTPDCVQQCQNGADWSSDKHFGKTAYSVGSTTDEIQQEIFDNGPVEAAFYVYEDFLTYKTGVYSHQSGSMLGGHAVKVLGWGHEDSTPYWLVANSWNNDWGDNGYFKILLGNDECGIESSITAGMPKLGRQFGGRKLF